MKKMFLLFLSFLVCLVVACQPDKTFTGQINANGGISTPYVLYPDGTKQTTANGGTVTMVYPSIGIPLSTGTSWGASIPNNSVNWNTAFSWGNHVGLYKPISYIPSWNEITGKPLAFPPAAHTHNWTEILNKPPEIELSAEIPLLQGIATPNMTTTQITSIINPVKGLLVYDITLDVMKFWNGTIWKILPTTN